MHEGDVKSAANQIFEKKFQFYKVDNWKIEEQLLFQEYYEFPNLLALNEQLNEVKSKLNDYDVVEWSIHTRKRDPSTEVVWKLKNTTNVEFATVAWCKFYECLCRFPLVKGPRINSLHLCEAPGAFITALNHYLHSTYSGNENNEVVTWKWLGTTLNPYYEGNALSQMIADDRFIRGTLDHWLFFEDFTGNIINCDNISQIEKQCSARLDDSVHLISADGSIDCWEKPDLQEETVSLLHWAEITAALSILADGGCFVLKMFTLFKATSVSKMYLLNCVFDSVHVFKPATSKQGNSEIYIICIGYRKTTPYLTDILSLLKNRLKEEEVQKFQAAIPLFAKAHLPKEFLMQHEVCLRLFMNHQINAIESNIYSYTVKHPNARYCAHILRIEVTRQYYERYQIRPLPYELRILQHQKAANIENNRGLFNHKGSYSDKQNPDAMKISTMINDINELEKLLDLQIEMNYEMQSPSAVGDPFHDIHQYHSNPVTNVQSSLFTNMPLLLLYKKVLNEYNKNAIWTIESTCHLDHDDDAMIIHWKDDENMDFASAQQQFYQRILDACIEHRPQKLKFTNLLVLTHYSASILRYLSLHVFDYFSITNNHMGIISLTINTEQKTWPQRLKALSQLRESLQDRLFCIMKLNELHGNEFSEALIQYNDRQLSRHINTMLNGFIKNNT